MIQSTCLTVDRRKEWNEFVARNSYFVLMQSWEWGEFKKRNGWQAIRLAIETEGEIVAGAQILIKSLPLSLASIAYIPRGPLVNWDDEKMVQHLLSTIHKTAQKYRAINLKIEPAVRYSAAMHQKLRNYDFEPSKFNNQPQCSMLIDLTYDEDTIMANMDKKTRYNVRYSARKGVTVRQANEADFGIFYKLIEYTAERAGFPARSEDYYRQEWEAFAAEKRIALFLAIHDEEVIAARMPAAFGEIAATLHSGSFGQYQKLKPNELLMWECIKWAKSRGCQIYDVWGIPEAIGANKYKGTPLPENQQGGLWGVYKFKRGFGGELVYYVGAYDYAYSKPLSWLMNTTIDRLGSLEKLAQLEDRLSFGSSD